MCVMLCCYCCEAADFSSVMGPHASSLTSAAVQAGTHGIAACTPLHPPPPFAAAVQPGKRLLECACEAFICGDLQCGTAPPPPGQQYEMPQQCCCS